MLKKVEGKTMGTMGNSFKFFRPEGWASKNVHLDWLQDYTPSAMAEAFKIAADRIIDTLATDVGHPDKFFYPVAYLYRHYLELELKNLIETGMELLPPGSVSLKGLRHDVGAAWIHAKRVLLVVWPDGDQRELRPVEDAVREFALLDPDGQGFRYYRNLKGDRNLEQAPRVISLEALKEEMDEVFKLLSGCSMGIDYFLEQKHEFEQGM